MWRPSGATCASPRSRASTIWLAAQISTSASQIVAMPCSAVASTRIDTSPMRKSIGVTRRTLARERTARTSVLRVAGSDVTGARPEEFELLTVV